MSDQYYLEDDYVKLLGRYAKVEARLIELRGDLMYYGTHVHDCRGTGSRPCECGWDDVIAKLVQEKRDAESG